MGSFNKIREENKMKRPQESLNDIMRRVAAFSVKERVFLVGVRGYYRRTMGDPAGNDRGIYDDAIFLVTPKGIIAFNANTDPAIFRRGMASLAPGLHYYIKGKHGLSRPGGGYPALRPATADESLPVTRDGKTGPLKAIAINIHRGGYNTTGSEGCQTIYPGQWIEFISSVYNAMDKAGQKRIPYILVENAE